MTPAEAKSLGERNGRNVVRSNRIEIFDGASNVTGRVRIARDIESQRTGYYESLARRMGPSLYGPYERGLEDGIKAELGRLQKSRAIVRRGGAKGEDLEYSNPWVIGGIVAIGAVIALTLVFQPRPVGV